MAQQLHIAGIVQGVGYRAAFQAQARALKLSGWVRNRRDGSVEALVCGADDAIRAIVDWARQGPPGARVSGLTATPTDDAAVQQGTFDIWPTR